MQPFNWWKKSLASLASLPRFVRVEQQQNEICTFGPPSDDLPWLSDSFDENLIECLVRLGPHPMPLSDPRSTVMMLHDPISGASIGVSILVNFISRSLFTLDFCIFRSSIPLRLASTKLYPRPFASLLDVRFRTVEPCGRISLSLISSFDT